MIPYRTVEERARAAERLARHLSEGGLIAYPTETVYGLGCALESAALERLAAFKGDRPFLLLVREPEDAADLAWTPAARRLAARFWPGPLTLALLDPHHRFPDRVRGAGGTVAIRVSPHPAAAALLDAAGGPLTSTSANAPGNVPAREALDAARAVEPIRDIVVLDGGRLPPGPSSTIVRCTAGVTVLRAGAVPVREIEAVVKLE